MTLNLEIFSLDEQLQAALTTMSAINNEVKANKETGWEDFWNQVGEGFSSYSVEWDNGEYWGAGQSNSSFQQRRSFGDVFAEAIGIGLYSTATSGIGPFIKAIGELLLNKTEQQVVDLAEELQEYGITVDTKTGGVSVNKKDIFKTRESAMEAMSLLAGTGQDISGLQKEYQQLLESGYFEQQEKILELQKQLLAKREQLIQGEINSADEFVEQYNNLVNKGQSELGLTKEDAEAWALSYLSALESASDFVIEATLKI